MKAQVEEIDKKYEEKYKGVLLKQKMEIQDLKTQLDKAKHTHVEDGNEKVKWNIRHPSEDFLEVEERKSERPSDWQSEIEVQEPQVKSKYQPGTKESEFEQTVNILKPRIDQFNEDVIDMSKEIEVQLDEMKQKINEQSNVI